MKVLLIIFLLTGFSIFTPRSVLACSCAPPRTPTENLQLSTNVFSGKVTNIVESNKPGKGGNILVTFSVVNIWKGERAEQLTLLTHKDPVACGFPFEKDEEYFVYSHQSEDGMLQTSTCSQTKKLSQAETDIKELGSGYNIREVLQSSNFYWNNLIIIGIFAVGIVTFLLLSGKMRNHKK